MDKKNTHIAEAAIRVISRYGLRKTTMGDLAKEAGVSRQTLYNTYSSKEEVIRDAIRFATDSGISALRSAWAKDETLGARLDSFFEIGPLYWFDLIQASPDAADLLDGLNAAGSNELADGSRCWTSAITGILRPYETALQKAGLDAADLADFIYSSGSSAKYTAQTRAQLVKRLAALKASVLALIGVQ